MTCTFNRIILFSIRFICYLKKKKINTFPTFPNLCSFLSIKILAVLNEIYLYSCTFKLECHDDMVMNCNRNKIIKNFFFLHNIVFIEILFKLKFMMKNFVEFP